MTQELGCDKMPTVFLEDFLTRAISRDSVRAIPATFRSDDPNDVLWKPILADGEDARLDAVARRR